MTTWRRTWLALAVVAVVAPTVLLAFDHARSWHYFVDAAHLLLDSAADGGGLALYHARPELQFGPVVIVVAVPFHWLPATIGEWAIMAIGSLAGVAGLACGVEAVRIRRPEIDATTRRVAAVVGVLFIVWWLRLSAYTTHVDDVIALSALAASGLAIERRRPGWVVAALAVAAAAKPWAIGFVPMALLADDRRRLDRPLLVVGLAAATWLPFLIAAPGTVGALRSFALDVHENSGLRAIGSLDPAAPAWVRPTQLALVLAVTTLAILHRSWPAAFVAGIAARMLVDPATEHYYTTGFVLAALLYELDRWPGGLPWRTGLAALFLGAAGADLTLGGHMAVIRFVLLAATIVAVIAAPDRRPSGANRLNLRSHRVRAAAAALPGQAGRGG